MARGVGRPPKHLLSRNSSQEASDGENSGGSNGENSGINLLQPPPSQLWSSPSTPLKQTISSSSHNSNYVAPQWLLDKTTAKFFSVPIPGVPPEVQDALEHTLLDGGDLKQKRQARKSHKLFAQIKHWKGQLQLQRHEVEQQKEMLARAISTRDTKLAAIRKQKMAEIDQKLQKMEDKLSQEKDEKMKQVEEETRKKIVEEFEVAFEKQEEDRKRKRKEEEEAKEEAAKEEKDEKDKKEASSEEGAEPDAKRAKKKLESEIIQEKIDAANAKMESLTEKKSEMIWLMKQVIKAEMKQKLMDPRKKESS
ncbi:unnamed protein product [Cylindrotheca closterium]|uniref:Uncharacterized protein n=1 Tax=Cylindrotheca closterium TaxID=2856 RepID=A0AAD2CK75_9STRA|nr:unnamed protein product [Cylindrotheca closterium]